MLHGKFDRFLIDNAVLVLVGVCACPPNYRVDNRLHIFLWPAIAAALVGFVDIWPLDGQWQIQLILFSIITIVLSIVAPPKVKPWLHRTQADHMTLNERGAQKIGRKATVDQTFVNGAGKVRFGDTLWLADSESGEDFSAGVQVEIVAAEGTKLIVKAAS